MKWPGKLKGVVIPWLLAPLDCFGNRYSDQNVVLVLILIMTREMTDSGCVRC